MAGFTETSQLSAGLLSFAGIRVAMTLILFLLIDVVGEYLNNFNKVLVSIQCKNISVYGVPIVSTVLYILVYPALDFPAPRLTGRVSLLLKGEKALSNKPPSFRFSAIVLMKVKLFNNLFC